MYLMILWCWPTHSLWKMWVDHVNLVQEWDLVSLVVTANVLYLNIKGTFLHVAPISATVYEQRKEEVEEQYLKLALRLLHVCSVSSFVFLASAYEGRRLSLVITSSLDSVWSVYSLLLRWLEVYAEQYSEAQFLLWRSIRTPDLDWQSSFRTTRRLLSTSAPLNCSWLNILSER